LEGNILENRIETLAVLSKQRRLGSSNDKQQQQQKQKQPVSKIESFEETNRSCQGLRTRTKSGMLVQSAIDTAILAFESEMSVKTMVPPLPQVEARNARLAHLKKRNGSVHSYESYGIMTTGSEAQSTICQKTGYRSPCDDWSSPPSEIHCTACGKYPPEHAMRIDAAPLPEYGMEVRVDLCHDCSIAQGVLRHVRYLGWLYEVEASGRAAILLAWEEVKETMERIQWENEGLDSKEENESNERTRARVEGSRQNGLTSINFGSPEKDKGAVKDTLSEVALDDSDYSPNDQRSEGGLYESFPPPPPFLPKPEDEIRTDEACADALLDLVCTRSFVDYRQRSTTLDALCHGLESSGRGFAPEFLESIEEFAQAAESTFFYGVELECEDGADDALMHHRQRVGLKKEAFKVAGDMSAALKLLYEYALPPDRGLMPQIKRYSPDRLRDNSDMLAAILEFFLDLCDEGQLEAVSFFWPQLCHIHMQMLPPRGVEEMIRVELMEDFLLTVSTRYSVHLALDLVWGLTADLEESLSSSNCHPASRLRRFAVLRFVSELESLLFDFDGGWGGGGVSLNGMLSPSDHQAGQVRGAMSLLQLYRRFGSHYLTRSVRLEKLRGEALEALGEYPSSIDESSQVRADIAKNAAYFSSHIAFARKLGDIAEKLRFTDVSKRSTTLELELKELNASGKILGGDPLNRPVAGRFYRAVNIPINEGHVFRSKERTPVLFLTELVPEILPSQKSKEVEPIAENDVNPESDLDSSAAKISPSEESKPTSDNIDEDVETETKVQSTSEIEDDASPLSSASSDKFVTSHDMDDAFNGENTSQASGSAKEESAIAVSSGKDTESAEEEQLNEDADDNEKDASHASTSVEAERPAKELNNEDDDDLMEVTVVESENMNGTCPKTPTFRRRTMSESLHGSVTHGVLTLTPRASEATTVTKEGKEMMADMIADLIENKQMQSPTSPLDSDVRHQRTVSMDFALDAQKEAFDHAKLLPPDLSPVNEAPLVDQPIDSNEVNASEDDTKSSPVKSPPEITRENTTKISALGSVYSNSGRNNELSEFARSSGIHLSSEKQFRRDVLFAIMERGMRGSNVIARGAANAARRAVQTMDRNRAIALMNESTSDGENQGNNGADTAKRSIQNKNTADITISASIDEDEVMEALRLLIIQNRVAQENLSAENAVRSTGALSPSMIDPDVAERTHKGVDAGEVDHRLAGCGRISSSILSALRLWKGGIVSNGELLELVQKDLQFIKQAAIFGSTDERKLIEDSAFWGRFSFGERWAEKKARLAASSPHGSLPGWDLAGSIVKSNDDLRQEAFVMQLIELCAEAFQTAGLDLWIHPYKIVATGRSTGIIECVRNAMSFDSLKKRPGYGTEGLLGHFQRMTEIAADPYKALNEAKENFVRSLAAYSLMSYLFMFKDRHNGNLLLDTAGHVIHIDFGFVFGIAPGGSFSLEQSTPFKLTEEMLEVMGGLESPLFSEFVTLFCCGFLALQAHADTFLTVVEITCKGSNFHCFDGKDPDEIVSKLRERFCPELNKSQTVAYALDLIKFATTSYGTKQYDYFQYLSQGIAT
jgi:Pyruvate/2-oxoacid:ferredoxin oxidoreductase delta subunit